MTYSSLHVYITTYFIFISAHSPSSHYPTTRRLSSLCLSLPHRSPFHRQTPSLRSSSSIARPISPPPSSKEPGIPVRPLLWRFAADLGCATGSRPKGDTEESPPQRSGKIDPTKGDFRRRLLAPRLLRSNACGNPARPADAKLAGSRLDTGTAISSTRGDDRLNIRVLAGGPVGVEISDTLETGTMAKKMYMYIFLPNSIAITNNVVFYIL